VPVVCFVGSSGVDKTTRIENVVAEFKARGYHIAVIKHEPHKFNIDKKGKDSWRFSHAGADIVTLSSKDRVYFMQHVVEEASLEQIITIVEKQVDLVLVDGYKHSSLSLIEVVPSSVNSRIIHRPEDLLAIVSDHQIQIDIPQFSFKEVKSITNFLIEQIANGALNRRVSRMAADKKEL